VLFFLFLFQISFLDSIFLHNAGDCLPALQEPTGHLFGEHRSHGFSIGSGDSNRDPQAVYVGDERE